MKKVNLEKIPWFDQKSPKARYQKLRRNISRAMDSNRAGAKLPGQPPFEIEFVRMPPGAVNFPFHSHAAEWECYLVLSGIATIRAGKRKAKLVAGDCVMWH